MRITNCMLLFSAGLFITACGGGGGGGGSNNPGAPIGDLPSGYIFDYDETGQKSLVAVDATNPSLRFTVQAPSTYRVIEDILSAATFDAATQTVTGARVAALVYESGGRLFKLADTKPGSPTPVQISSASGISACPESWSNSPPTNSDTSYIVVQTSGADGSCGTLGDNQYLLVRLNMSDTEAPLGASRPIDGISDEISGVPLGWLVASGGQIFYYDNNFQNPVTLSESYVSEPKDLVNDFLAIDNKVFRFTPSSGALQLIHTAPSGISLSDVSTSDGNYIYFVRSDNILFRAPLDGSLAATEVYSGLELSGLTRMSATTNRVVFANSSKALYSVPKSAAAATATFLMGNLGLFVTNGTRVFYDGAATGTVFSGLVNEDGSDRSEVANSFFVGLTVPSTISLKGNPSDVIDKIIRLENLNGASGTLAGATLKSINLSSGAEVANLGRLPGGSYQGLRTRNLSVGDAGFLQQFVSGSDAPIGSISLTPLKPIVSLA